MEKIATGANHAFEDEEVRWTYSEHLMEVLAKLCARQHGLTVKEFHAKRLPPGEKGSLKIIVPGENARA